MNRRSVRPLLSFASMATVIAGTTFAADAQIFCQTKSPSDTAGASSSSGSTSVRAHITVTAEPGVTQVEKAHEKAQTLTEPLTKVQLERLAANARIYKEKVRPLQAELHVDKLRLMDVLTDEDVSVPHAQLLQAKIGVLKADIRDLQLKKQLADSAIMTAGQRKELRGQLLRRASEQHKILALSGKSTQ